MTRAADDPSVTADETQGPASERVGRRRTLLVAAGLAGLIGVAGALAIVARPSGSTPSTNPQTQSPGSTLRIVARFPITTTSAPASAPTTVVTSRPAPPPTTTGTTTPGDTRPAPTVPATLPRPAPVTLPPIRLDPAVTATLPPPTSFGPDVLVWDAPFTLDVVSGHTATLSVTAHNPTDLAAALPHPLSCTPRLDERGVCAQIVQLVGAGQSASATYTIDAHGIAPGVYALDVEGVLTVAVTVS